MAERTSSIKQKKKRLISLLGYYYDLPSLISENLREVRRYSGENEAIVVSIRENYKNWAKQYEAEMNSIKLALEKLDSLEFKIIQLRYMNQNHKNYRPMPWKEIAYKVGYCDSGWINAKASIAMDKLCKILFD